MTSVCMYTPSAGGGHALYTQELLTHLVELEQSGTRPVLVTSQDTCSELRVPYEVAKVLPRLRKKEAYPHRSAWLTARARHYWVREQRFLEWLRERPDISVVHIQEFAPWLAPYFFTRMRRLGKRLVYTVHNLRPHSKRFLAPLYRTAWRHCDALIVHSESLKYELSKLLGKHHPPIFVIPHGVWSTGSATVPNLKRRLAERHLLFFGVIRENKGLHNLLDAMLELPGYSLTVAGSAADHRPYFDRKLLPRLVRLESRNIHVEVREGFIPDAELPSLFERCSALVLPYENFSAQSGVLYLALAYGLPVVVSDTGALGETVRALSCGLVLENTSPKKLAEAIRVLHVDLSVEELESNLKQAKEKLSWSHTAQLTTSVYAYVLNKAGVHKGVYGAPN